MGLNTQQLRGQWKQISGEVKKRWGMLTDDDLRIVDGNFDQLVGTIERKTGEARDAVEKALNDLAAESASVACRITESVKGYTEKAGAQVRQGYDEARTAVRENPVPSMAIAFGIGLGIGMLVGPALRQSPERWR